MGRGGDAVTGVVAWFTGLPSSGKTTLASEVAGELHLRGIEAVTLDSDELRRAVFPDLGHDAAARELIYGTLGKLAALLARQGHIVLVPATAHLRSLRDAARALAPAFVEIFVDTPLADCQRRDPKGTYRGDTRLVPGIGVTYEPPLQPEFRVPPNEEDAAARIAAHLDDMD
jgi:adenylylsulfate kinase